MKDKVKAIILILMFGLILTSCSNNKNKEKLSEKENILLGNIKDADYGSVGPKLVFANDTYVAVLHPEGLIIANNKTNEIESVINVKELELNKLQGSSITTAYSDDEDLILSNINDENGKNIKINLKSKKIEDIETINLEKYRENEIYNLSDEEIEVLKDDLLDEYTSVLDKEDVVVLTNNYEGKDKKYRIIRFNKEDMSKYKAFDLL